MPTQAARTFGCEVDTLTLSKEQKALAEERIKAAGLQDRIRVHLMDYREIPAEFEKAFDAFISIEMLEVRTFVASSITRLLIAVRFSMWAQSIITCTSSLWTLLSNHETRLQLSALRRSQNQDTPPISEYHTLRDCLSADNTIYQTRGLHAPLHVAQLVLT